MQPPDNDLINRQSNEADSLSTKRRHHLGHLRKEVAWYFIPLTVIASTVLYITLAFVWHVNPPVVPVEGQSMRPFLQTGDLVLLHGVNPAALKKGDVIAEAVPLADQQKYHIPGRVVHRIISIADTPQGGYIFQTKGDANGGPDVFQTPAANVIGIMTGKITGMGYPILFLKSRQGEIFVGAALLVTIAYLLLGWAQRRQEQDPAIELLEMLLAETSALSTGVNSLVASDQPARQKNLDPHDYSEPRGSSDDSDEYIMPKEASSVSSSHEEPQSELTSAVTASIEMGSTTNESVRELLEAMREYAEHLRSHTAAIRGMSQASMDLASVTSDIRNLLEGAAGQSTKLPIELPQSFEPPQSKAVGVQQSKVEPGFYEDQSEIFSPREVVKDTIEAGHDEPAILRDIEHGSATRIYLSIELDLHRIQTKFKKATRKQPEYLKYSPTFCYIAWAAATALHLVLGNKDSRYGNDRSLKNWTLEVEGPNASTETQQVVIGNGQHLSFGLLLNQLNSRPEPYDSSLAISALRIVDWTQSNLLLAAPSKEASDHLMTVNVGGIRRCPTVVVDEYGSEGIAIHPIAVLTVVSTGVHGTVDLQNYLELVRHLVE